MGGVVQRREGHVHRDVVEREQQRSRDVAVEIEQAGGGKYPESEEDQRDLDRRDERDGGETTKSWLADDLLENFPRRDIELNGHEGLSRTPN